ncbi:methyltransferase-like protein 27 isoform X1 [Xenia sp. Carnegie-2017]|uniref:methyltransferase-like protein 27 isoform X1 n=1 Tax=Xenia sp. Carnegie-2017 TaxID=2897299 RepID=UPI001F034589|nr:methyltransferase-like protein 27 isoform X1 [Xenia sp. Carnegie-2017]
MDPYEDECYTRLKQFTASTPQQDVVNLYSKWAATYEKVADDISYQAPVVAAEQLHEELIKYNYNQEIEILDLGCGTGLVGEHLYKLGYKNVDGIDISEEMLKLSEAKGVYRSLKKGTMGSDGSVELGVTAGQYDAVICVGVFAPGHVKGKGMDDFIHSVKQGGVIFFTINELVLDDPGYGFHRKLEEITKQGKWKPISKYFEPRYANDKGAIYFIFQKQ